MTQPSEVEGWEIQFDNTFDEQFFDEDLGNDGMFAPRERIKEFIRTALTSHSAKEREEAVVETEKAYGGCHYCYGKGYGTQTAAWVGRGYYKKVPTMKFCTCERGKQLEQLLTPQTDVNKN